MSNHPTFQQSTLFCFFAAFPLYRTLKLIYAAHVLFFPLALLLSAFCLFSFRDTVPCSSITWPNPKRCSVRRPRLWTSAFASLPVPSFPCHPHESFCGTSKTNMALALGTTTSTPWSRMASQTTHDPVDLPCWSRSPRSPLPDTATFSLNTLRRRSSPPD